MNESEILIQSLPADRELNDLKPLVLKYDSSKQIGSFFYDQQLIPMDYRSERVRFKDGKPSQHPSVRELFFQESIPCYWLGVCLLNPSVFFPPNNRNFEFTFERDTRTWRCFKYRKEIEGVYHTTFYDIDELTLVFDLINMRGSYTHYDYYEQHE